MAKKKARKAPAKKTPAKKAVAKKTPAKKTPAKKKAAVKAAGPRKRLRVVVSDPSTGVAVADKTIQRKEEAGQ